MPAETLNCPMCGAAASTDATHCDHCGARLATVACPSCFGMIFAGAKFCSHCGARVDRTELPAGKTYSCPRCHTAMEAVTVGGTSLLECQKCEGLWVDTDTLEQICADREKQSAVLGLPMHLPTPDPNKIEVVHYIPCPICHQLMARFNFAHCSGVVVDVCKQHGTWFDQNELRRVVEFIRTGGMEKARQQEKDELEQERHRLDAARSMAAFDATLSSGSGAGSGSGSGFGSTPDRYDGFNLALSALGSAINLFLKK
jgi:Zn-finger nucleic acid-binding protein